VNEVKKKLVAIPALDPGVSWVNSTHLHGADKCQVG